MDHEEKRDKLMEYLYGEMPPQERPSFQQEVDSNPEFKTDLLNYIQIREMVQEHMPRHKAPAHLTKKLFEELGIRQPWYESIFQGMVRPALAGAMVLALTIGVAYQVRERQVQETQVSVVSEPSKKEFPRVDAEATINEMLMAKRSIQPRLTVPDHTVNPGLASRGPGGLVTLAGVGGTYQLRAEAGIPTPEISNLDIKAKRAVAQFIHQQALRMRAMGQFKAAAEHLDHLIKTYPFYPLKFEALAQRIDCLFKAGEQALAHTELTVLRGVSPTLAYLVERRWGGAFQE